MENTPSKPQYQTWQFYLIISLIVVLGLIISTVLILTSVIWVPLLIINIPLIAIGFAILRFTSLGKPVLNVYYSVYDWLFYKSEKPRKMIWGFVYNSMCLLYPQTHWRAMNYGYAILNQEGKLIKNLKEEDEEERFCLQLYHYVATKFTKVKELSGLDVLEIGSGRGGGLSYISKYLNPKSCVGVDLSENQVRFCNSMYQSNPNIKFFQGDAEKIDEISEIKESSFDNVINVESSHCYGSFESFLKQVSRVTKPGGYFLFTDFRTQEGYEELKTIFQNSEDWEIENEEDITLNVVTSLKLDEARRFDIITQNVSRFIQPLFKKFSGLEGTRINKEFQERSTIYVAFVLKNVKK